METEKKNLICRNVIDIWMLLSKIDPFNSLDKIKLVTAHHSFWLKYHFQGSNRIELVTPNNTQVRYELIISCKDSTNQPTINTLTHDVISNNKKRREKKQNNILQTNKWTVEQSFRFVLESLRLIYLRQNCCKRVLHKHIDSDGNVIVILLLSSKWQSKWQRQDTYKVNNKNKTEKSIQTHRHRRHILFQYYHHFAT